MRWIAWITCAALLGIGCGDDDGVGGDGGAPMPSRDGGGDGDDDGGGNGDGDPVARGKYLVENVAVCIDCHTPRGEDGEPDMERYLAGVDCFADADPMDPDFGCLPSRNLTNHESGLKNRSDQEIKDMILKGERPDGSALHPIMPYYVFANMRDGDADAIVAYLRTVDGVDNMLPDAQPPFRVEAPAPIWPEAMIPMPGDDYPEREAALRGRYLAGNVGICMECHTARGEMREILFDKAFQGGRVFSRAQLGLPDAFPEEIVSPNVTPHATGIDGLSIEDIVVALKEGTDPTDDLPFCPPMPGGAMPGFGSLTDRDAEDIAHYLLSIPGRDNEIATDCRPPGPPVEEDAGL